MLDVVDQPRQGRALHIAPGIAPIVVVLVDDLPTFVLLALDVVQAGLTLGVERVEGLIQTLLVGFAGVDGTTQFLRLGAHWMDLTRLRPKKRGPDQWAPVMA